METRINSLNDPQAVRNYSTKLAVDTGRKTWWKKFMGRDENSVVHERIDLEKGSGDVVQFDLNMRLRGEATFGDEVIVGKEEALKFLVDEVRIDQVRKAASGGSRMSNQRTVHDLRTITKERLSTYFAEWTDEVFHCYAAGVAGSVTANEDAIYISDSFAGNPVEAPDAFHQIYGGDATSKADLDAADKMSAALIRRVAVKAKTLNERNPNVVRLRPISIEGAMHHLVIMSEEQSYDLRTNAAATEWLEISKHAGVRGGQNPLFTASLGMIDNVVLQASAGIRRFIDYGAGQNVQAARALFLGAQALTVGYGKGNDNGSRMFWVEEMVDAKNSLNVYAGMIMGVKKTRFKPKTANFAAGTGTDFGVLAMDTAAAAVA